MMATFGNINEFTMQFIRVSLELQFIGTLRDFFFFKSDFWARVTKGLFSTCFLGTIFYSSEKKKKKENMFDN